MTVAELRQKIDTMQKEVRTLLDEKKIEEANSKMAELRAARMELKTLEELEEDEKRDLEGQSSKETGEPGREDAEYRSAFVKTLRCLGYKSTEASKLPLLTDAENRALSSYTDEDGRLLIPQDIRTRIRELRREFQDIYDYVNVETVGQSTGKRPIEQEPTLVPLEGVAELVTIPDIGNPKFLSIEYAVKDFKGLMEIPNTFLKDEDADIIGYLAKWIARKIVATHNMLIFYADGTKGTQGILGVEGAFPTERLNKPMTGKDIKKIFNVVLPSAIAKSSIIVTNQSGFNHLDTLQDKNGRDLLEHLGGDKYKLDKNPVTIAVFDDQILLNDKDGHVPFIFGNLREAITYFDRERMSIDTSKEIGFKEDSTFTRVIMRGDSRFVDKKALCIVYAPVDTETAAG